MHLTIFALPRKLKIAAPVGFALIAAVMLVAAQSAAERYAIVIGLAGVGAGGYVGMWAVATAGRIMVRDAMLVDETLHRMVGIVERLQADPRTAAGGQEAMEAVRSIWGERAEEWLKKSDLN